MEIIQGIITGLSVIAAILAWIAKLRWSKEYSTAKEEIIRLKDAQIESQKETILTYKDLTPEKIWIQYESLKKFYDDYINVNEQKIKAAQDTLQVMDVKILELEKTSAEYASMKEKYEGLDMQYKILERNLNKIKNDPGNVPIETILKTSGSSAAISDMIENLKYIRIQKITEYHKDGFLRQLYKVSPDQIVDNEKENNHNAT